MDLKDTLSYLQVMPACQPYGHERSILDGVPPTQQHCGHNCQLTRASLALACVEIILWGGDTRTYLHAVEASSRVSSIYERIASGVGVWFGIGLIINALKHIFSDEQMLCLTLFHVSCVPNGAKILNHHLAC